MYQQKFGKAATADTLTYLRREVMHAVWLLLLDDDFIDAYTNGIIIKFHDGIERLVFPRLFTYSADYPEKCDFTIFHHSRSHAFTFVGSSLHASSILVVFPVHGVLFQRIASTILARRLICHDEIGLREWMMITESVVLSMRVALSTKMANDQVQKQLRISLARSL